ncbi:hypothetical protein H0X91_17970 [Burkholderia sp. 9777_1386]|uniref:hypothetical protein n=1 Tax=Burkholderia sp. 9777_1386 TaxID=2751183 RepID=UPI0018C39567|nr:hypothetical protein [Burkholderia sp. 9777_1386]MBG0871858.1 hypothetical protein [Burkholderia sp. 9777_1386]
MSQTYQNPFEDVTPGVLLERIQGLVAKAETEETKLLLQALRLHGEAIDLRLRMQQAELARLCQAVAPKRADAAGKNGDWPFPS